MGILKNIDQSINNKIIIKTTLFILIFSTVFLSLDIFFEYQRNIKHKQEVVKEIEENLITPISITLWDFNLDMARSLAHGIEKNEEIVAIEIENHKGDIFLPASQNINGLEKLEYILHTSQGNYKNSIGKLIVYLKNESPISKVISTHKYYFIVHFFEIIFITLFLYLSLRKLIINPLQTLKLEIEKNSNEPITIDKVGGKDEIDYVIDSINKLKKHNFEQLNHIKENEIKLKEYNDLLLLNQEEERKRISFFLHDSIGQQLVSIKLFAQMEGYSHKIIDEIQNIIKEVKNLSYGILPAPITNLTFKQGINWLIENTDSTLPVSINIDDECNDFQNNTKINIYRITQELLQNSIKYSEIEQIKVNIKRIENDFYFQYICSGKQKSKVDKYKKRLGSISLHERVRQLNGLIKSDEVNDIGEYIFLFNF